MAADRAVWYSYDSSLYLLVLAVDSLVFIDRGLSTAPGELQLWGTLFAFTAAATLSIVLAVDPARLPRTGMIRSR